MIQRVQRLLNARPAVRHISELMLGTLVGQAILILAAPLLTRLYTPSDYGVLATYSALVVILSVVVTLRYELALLLPRDPEEAEQLSSVSVMMVAALSLLTGALLWGLAYGLNLGILQSVKPYLGLLIPGIALYGASQILSFRRIRLQQFRVQAHSRWLLALAYVLTQLTGGLLKLGALGLMLGQVMGQLVALLALGWRWRPDMGAWRSAWLLLKRYWQFPVYSVPAALLNTLSQQLPLLLAASLYSLKEAGWLALGLRLIGTPVDLAGASIGQVYLGRASEYAHRSPAELRRLVWRTLRALFAIGILPTLLLMAFAPPLFALVFGSEWRTTGEYLQILAPLLLMRLMAAPIAQTLTITRSLPAQFGWEFMRALLVFASFWLPAQMSQPLRVALVGYTVVYLLSLGLLIGLILWSVPRAFNVNRAGLLHHEPRHLG